MSEEIVGTTAGCVIKQNGKYLLVQEGLPKAYGLWNMPAGHTNPGETPEEAAVREVREETGYEVELDELISVFTDGPKLRYTYTAHIVGGELNFPKDEIMDAKWLTYSELEKLAADGKFRKDWIFKAIKSVELG